MTQGNSSTKKNLLDTYEFVQKNAPLTVGQYLDDVCPDRKDDPEQAQYAKDLFDVFKVVSVNDVFDMDLPVTEASVIRGFTENGLIAMSLLLKM